MELAILFLGDIVGKSGRNVLKEKLEGLSSRYKPDLILANGENAAGGLGLDPETAKEIFKPGVQLITTGNHVWHRKTLLPLLNEENTKILRPDNFPPGAAGKGWLIEECKGVRVGLVNLIGRVFMTQQVDCPFQAFDAIVSGPLKAADLIIVDFHAEATSEKYAFGYHVDGRAQLVVGTHTHVQTADERILPLGAGYISDLGMTGPWESVIGVKREYVVERFKTALPTKFEVASGKAVISGIFARIDSVSKRCVHIERVQEFGE